MSREDLRSDLSEQRRAADASGLSREEMIDAISANVSRVVVEKQGEYVEAAVCDMMKHPSNKKAYYAQKYGKVGRILPSANNYCVAIQQYGFYMASKDLGLELNQEMRREGFEVTDNIDFCRENRNGCATDTIAGPVTSYCPNLIAQDNNSSCGIRNPKLSDFVTPDGHVKKDKDGNPLLKDGDLIIGTVGRQTNTTSGKHCVRVNIDENGKVTYTAGNGDHLRVPRPGGVGFSLNTPVQIFHSEDNIKQNVATRLQNLTDEQLKVLYETYGNNKDGRFELNDLELTLSKNMVTPKMEHQPTILKRSNSR